ncbi:hypothetical protein GCM10010472_01850 [Pseudonocardia halophobica]|uniref:NADP-dependent oxidoreductase domain-containing protein n=1 Tax=Pseudonocardia halophobica TaxID=29401 RepID=A0A9W6NUQ3_9PSEU|nr:hypothetical protein GCM10017577_16650 [Pseudonocardia halophobica]
MQYRLLGRTGISVSTLCLGGGVLGTRWGNLDVEDSARVVHAALDAGINFVDTADAYEESEVYLGKALRGHRDDVVLTSKVNNRLGTGVNDGGNSKRWIKRAVENSLRRLQTDHLDLYQVHRPEPNTDIDETLSALTDLVREGKVLHIGTSTFSGAEIVEAEWVADRRGRAGSPPPRCRTRCSIAAPRPRSCPRPRSTASASSPSARWPAECSPTPGRVAGTR